MAKTFLENMYNKPGSIDAAEVYAHWADSYDKEVTQAGYATPLRCAEALSECAPDKSSPLLDLGCGTGLSGLAFRRAGFQTLDGADVVSEMLQIAANHEGLYRRLVKIDPDAPLPFSPGEYPLIAAVGVITPDHAPPEMISTLIDLLPANGLLVFSLNDHALSVSEFPNAVQQAVETGAAQAIRAEHGPHLPNMGLGSTVYVLKRN